MFGMFILMITGGRICVTAMNGRATSIHRDLASSSRFRQTNKGTTTVASRKTGFISGPTKKLVIIMLATALVFLRIIGNTVSIFFIHYCSKYID